MHHSPRLAHGILWPTWILSFNYHFSLSLSRHQKPAAGDRAIVRDAVEIVVSSSFPGSKLSVSALAHAHGAWPRVRPTGVPIRSGLVLDDVPVQCYHSSRRVVHRMPIKAENQPIEGHHLALLGDFNGEGRIWHNPPTRLWVREGGVQPWAFGHPAACGMGGCRVGMHSTGP